MYRFTKGFNKILSRRSICSEAEATAGFHVNVTSKSTIKPSSPTHPNLHHLKLSLLDHIVLPSLYANIVLFYPNPSKTMRQRLQHSLSKTLSHFYPLAGRIPSHENAFRKAAAQFSSAGISSIHCNDRGALFLEAEANQDLLHFLSLGGSAWNRELLFRLAPPFPDITQDDVPLLSVQTTAFSCGGIAVGVSLNHIIGDGHTFGVFLKKWAATTRGEDCSTGFSGAYYMAASLFPPNEPVSTFLSTALQKRARRTNSSTKLQRFVFKKKAVSALKSKVQSSEVPNPSRVVAVSGLIWKCAMNAAAPMVQSSNAISVVNLRPRLKRLLQNYSVGNIFWSTSACYNDGTSKIRSSSSSAELKELVYLLKQSIEVVDGEFVEKLTGEEGHKRIRELWEERAAVREYTFSSILNMGVNETDFGSGKPIWAPFVGFTDVEIEDTVCLMDGGDDGSVEALVCLDEKEMAIFERDPQLLEYAAVNPPIII